MTRLAAPIWLSKPVRTGASWRRSMGVATRLTPCVAAARVMPGSYYHWIPAPVLVASVSRVRRWRAVVTR